MSVDKFGRNSHKVGLRGPPGRGFKLTTNGDYDIGDKRLVNLAGAVDATDAVNLKFISDKCVVYNDDRSINATQITGLNDPTGDKDAVNKKYVDSVVPTRGGSYWGFGKRRLVSVKDPIDDADVVTKRFFKSNCPSKTKQGWGFDNSRLTLLKDPAEPQDAVTVNYLSKNLAEVREKWIPKQTTSNWHFGNKTLSSVGEPKDDTDVVTKKYLDNVKFQILEELKRHVTAAESSLSTITERLNSTPKWTEDFAAFKSELRTTEFEHMRENQRQIRKFGQLLFPYVHGTQRGRNAQSLTADNYINYEEIFGTSGLSK